jgi:hypothetical protein
MAEKVTRFDEFLLRKRRLKRPERETRKAVKRILDYVVSEAYPSLTLQSCCIVMNSTPEPTNPVLREVMDELYRAFLDLNQKITDGELSIGDTEEREE